MADDQRREAISNVIDRYFIGLASGDLSDVPFSRKIVFQGALDPQPIVGSDEVRNLLSQFGDAIEKFDIHEKVIEGDIACVTFKWIGVSGSEIEMCDFFRFENSEIAYIRPYFDTRLLTGD